MASKAARVKQQTAREKRRLQEIMLMAGTCLNENSKLLLLRFTTDNSVALLNEVFYTLKKRSLHVPKRQPWQEPSAL